MYIPPNTNSSWRCFWELFSCVCRHPEQWGQWPIYQLEVRCWAKSAKYHRQHHRAHPLTPTTTSSLFCYVFPSNLQPKLPLARKWEHLRLTIAKIQPLDLVNCLCGVKDCRARVETDHDILSEEINFFFFFFNLSSSYSSENSSLD